MSFRAGLYFFVCKRKRVRIAEFPSPSADRHLQCVRSTCGHADPPRSRRDQKGRTWASRCLQDLASTKHFRKSYFAICSCVRLGYCYREWDHEVPSPAGFRFASSSVQNVNQGSMYHRQARVGNQLAISSRSTRALSERTVLQILRYVLHVRS